MPNVGFTGCWGFRREGCRAQGKGRQEAVAVILAGAGRLSLG